MPRPWECRSSSEGGDEARAGECVDASTRIAPEWREQARHSAQQDGGEVSVLSESSRCLLRCFAGSRDGASARTHGRGLANSLNRRRDGEPRRTNDGGATERQTGRIDERDRHCASLSACSAVTENGEDGAAASDRLSANRSGQSPGSAAVTVLNSLFLTAR